MSARPWQWAANGLLQGGQNACQAVAVAWQWPGNGLAVAWQWPGSLAVAGQGKLAELSKFLGAKG